MLRRRAYYSVQVLHGILYAIGGSTFHHESTVEMLVDPMDSWTSSELNLVTGRSTFATVKCARTIPSTYGQNLLYSITIRTRVGCYNCSSEGVVIRLKGGSRQEDFLNFSRLFFNSFLTFLFLGKISRTHFQNMTGCPAPQTSSTTPTPLTLVTVVMPSLVEESVQVLLCMTRERC